MRATTIVLKGHRRVLKSLKLVGLLYAANLLLAIPLAVTMKGIIADDIGGSLKHEAMTEGFDMDWHGEFAARHEGLAATFGPGVVAGLPAIGNFEKLLDGEIFDTAGPVVFAGLIFLLAWTFFAGGILGRFAEAGHAMAAEGFLLQCAARWFRFVRLLAISLIIYFALFRWIANPLHDWSEDFTRDFTTERSVMLVTFCIYAFIASLMILISMIGDYAKIAIVVENRKSALGAFLAAGRIVYRDLFRAAGVYALLLVFGFVVFLLYVKFAPGPGQSEWGTIFAAFVAGQVYLFVRIALKFWFLASATVLYEDFAARGIDDFPTPIRRFAYLIGRRTPEPSSLSHMTDPLESHSNDGEDSSARRDPGARSPGLKSGVPSL